MENFGYYRIMTEREQLNERIQKWLDEKKLKKQQELDNKQVYGKELYKRKSFESVHRILWL